MIDPQLIEQIKYLQIRAHKLMNTILLGEYASRMRGQGLEFDEAREYQPGDDIRRIDWNITARMEKPYVKVFREERELILILLVDISASMLLGSNDGRSKHKVSMELAALLGLLALKNNDKVGLVLFSDQVHCVVPPKKGRAHVWNIMRYLMEAQSCGQASDLAAALQTVRNLAKRRAGLFVISDFLVDDSYLSPLQILAQKHQIFALRIEDLSEMQWAQLGLAHVVDIEGLHQDTIWLPSQKDGSQSHWEAFYHSYWETWHNNLLQWGIRHTVIRPQDSLVRRLEDLFLK